MSVHVLVRAVRYGLERKQLERQLADYAYQLRLRNEVMEAELKIARDIQRAYLPLGEADFPRRDPSLDHRHLVHPSSGNFALEHWE